MKNIKKIIFFSLIFILSGCSVEYNLTINEDSTINEKVVATEKTKRMESLTRLKGDQAVTYLYDMFKRPNEDIKISSREDEYNTYATAITSHDSIDEYVSKFSSDVFENVKIEKNNGQIKFDAKQSKLLGGSLSYSLVYDDITVNVKIPFKVIDHNADSVKGNIYTWKINKDQDYKNINFTYEEGSKKDKVNVKVNKKTYNINYGIIVAGVMILLISVIVLFVYVKNKKNNIV